MMNMTLECIPLWTVRPTVLLLIALVVIVARPVIGQGEEEQRLSFVTSRGETFEKAKILRVEPDGISVLHSCGISKIPIEELPEELRERFQMDSSHAAQFRLRQAAAIRASEERIRKAVAEQQEEQRALDAQKDAKRTQRDLSAEELKKKRANYAWHPGGQEVVGRILLVQDGMVLIQLPNREGGRGRHLCSLDELPSSEQSRAAWIGERMTEAERRRGERALSEQLKYIDHWERAFARSAAQARDREASEARAGVRRAVEEGVQEGLRRAGVW